MRIAASSPEPKPPWKPAASPAGNESVHKNASAASAGAHATKSENARKRRMAGSVPRRCTSTTDAPSSRTMSARITDVFDIDHLFSDEERAVRDTVRKFVDKSVLPIVAKHYRDGTFPNELIPGFAELGLLGATLTGYGCAGMGPLAYWLALSELERADSGIRSFVSVQGSLCMYPIHAFGSDAQKEKWLPALAAGKKVGCFG